MIRERKIFFDIVILLSAISWGLLLYYHTLKAPFQFDDNLTIVENPTIKDIHNITWLWTYDPSRFLTHLTFALNYHWGGIQVGGYHIVNLVLHFLVVCILYVFLKLILASEVNKSFQGAPTKIIVVFATFLFLSHPIQTESVTFIAQRSSLLSALCYLLTLVFYILYRRYNKFFYYGFSIAIAFLGAFAKPNIVTLPLGLLLCEICFFDFSFTKSKKAFFRLLPFFLLLIIVPSLLILWKYKSFGVQYFMDVTRETAKISRKDYLLTQFNVLMTYLRLLVFPVNQNLDYDYPIARSFFSFPTFLSFGLLLGLVFAAIKMFKKERLVSFAIFWFFVTLSVESSFFPISDVIFEHRLYLPMIGFAIALPVCLMKLVLNRRLCIAILCVIIVIFSAASYRRNELWTNKIGFLLDVARKSPNKARVHNNLAIAYQEENDFINAEREYKKAIVLDSHYAFPHNNLGAVYMLRGRVAEAMEELRTALKIRPQYDSPYFNLGNIFYDQNDLEKAERNFNKAIEISPSFAPAYIGLGNVFLKRGNTELAWSYFKEAVRLNPDYPHAYLGLGDVYLAWKEYDGAIAAYTEAIRRKPNTASAYNNIGNILDIQERYLEAIENYKRAIAIDPQYANAYFNLSNTLKKIGQKEEAVRVVQTALHLFQDQKNKAMIELTQRRLQEFSK